MPAPRKFTDTQREAILRLSEGGMHSGEIAAACKEGRTGLEPFEISDRTVRDILAKMQEAAAVRIPATAEDLERAEAMARYPARAAGILEKERTRLEAKKTLTDRDLDRLVKLSDASQKIARLLQRSERGRGDRPAGKRAKSSRREEGPIERVAREEREREERGSQLSRTRTLRTDGEGDARSTPTTGEPADPPSPHPAADDVGAEVRRVAAAARARMSPSARDEAAQKARASLAEIRAKRSWA
jgi:hypothetical protein